MRTATCPYRLNPNGGVRLTKPENRQRGPPLRPSTCPADICRPSARGEPDRFAPRGRGRDGRVRAGRSPEPPWGAPACVTPDGGRGGPGAPRPDPVRPPPLTSPSLDWLDRAGHIREMRILHVVRNDRRACVCARGIR